MKHLSCLSASVLLFIGASAGAAEWFVSPDGTNAAGRGGTEEEPLRTINYAIDRASANDTITLLPGDYAEGVVEAGSLKNRVNITKPLTIRSKNGRASRDSTRIIGAYDDMATSPVGMGPNAVRCVRIDSAASGTRLEGITFYGGSTDYNGNTGAEKSEGGGVMVCNSLTQATIVDCAFVDCQATRGGGLYSDTALNSSVTAVRCRFLRCRDTKFGAGMRGGAAYFCVFDDCSKARDDSGNEVGDGDNPKDALAYAYRAVNCTFVNNMAHGIRVDNNFAGGIYNCLFQNNGANSNAGSIRPGSASPTTAYNVVGSANLYTKFEVLSPFDDDYRLTSSATALNAGSAGYLTDTYVPKEFIGTDYEGNAFDQGGTVHAGAVQSAIAAAACGVQVRRAAHMTWNFGGVDAPVCVATWRGKQGWPAPGQVGIKPDDGYALVRFEFNQNPHWPLADNSIWLSPKKNQVQELTAISTTNIYYADPENGSDENAGTSKEPFRTLNAAVNATTASHVVYARRGDYNAGGETYAGTGNRVVVPQALAGELRVVAVDGSENTFITGAPGTGNSTYKTGSDATRCIAVASTNKYYAAFQGFTVRDGHSAEGETWTSWGGALHNLNDSANNLNTAWLLDCVVTNCTARRGGAVSGGYAIRCRFLDCKGANNSGGVFRRCTIVSSLVDGCGGNTELFAQSGAVGYNCTVVNSTKSAVYGTSSSAACLFNSVVGSMNSSTEKALNNNTHGGVTNTLYDTKTDSASLGGGCKSENPILFLDAELGNYRLPEESKGYSLASTTYMESCMDIDGNPFVFDADGKYQAGCFAPRPASACVTYYVDPDRGSDSGDGSQAAPFATLAKAMSAAEYGDTVIALPGTYSSGTMLPSETQTGDAVATIAARVVVNGGVTLESRDGAGSTIIDGGGEIRGAFVCRNAVLRGFTVQNGKVNTSSSSSTASINDYGGGIACYHGTSGVASEHYGLVERCVIKDCQALRGGGASYGTYRNCVFTGNGNPLGDNKPGWAVRMARLEGCYFYGNGSAGKHSTAYDCSVFNCTFLGNNAGASSGNGIVCNEYSYTNNCTVVNSIILGNIKEDIHAVGCITNPAAAKLGDNGVPMEGSEAIDCIADDSSVPTALLAAGDAAGSPRKMNREVDCGAFEYDWRVPWSAALGRDVAIADISPDATLTDTGRLAFPDGTVSLTWDSRGIDAPYTYHVNVTGGGTLNVSANGETVGSYTQADGPKELRFRSELGENELRFEYVPGADDDGGAELYGFSHKRGIAIVIR